MTNPVFLSLNDVPPLQTTNAEMSQTQPVLTRQQFGDRVVSFLETSYRNGYDPDYVATELQKFAAENPETAKEVGFPTDHFGIKSLVVNRYYDFQKMRAKYGSEPAKAAECLADKAPEIIEELIQCVPETKRGNPFACLKPLKTIYSCQIDALKDENAQTDIPKN